MPSRGIQLSSQGLERAASSGGNDFTFIVEGVEMHCTQFEASFISPRVARLVGQDKTINSFFLEIDTDGIEWTRVIDLFRPLINGSGIVVGESEVFGLRQSDVFGLRAMAAALGNTELLNQFCDTEEITGQNVCSRMRNGDSCGRCIEEEIGFAASHFYELDFEELKDLGVSILERIVSSPVLRLEDEDSLLEFICKVDCDRPILVRHILSEYVKSDNMPVFLGFFAASNPDPVIWSSLCCRLVLPVWRPHNKVVIPMKLVGSTDGIISYLVRKHCGNLHEKGIVTITSQSDADDNPDVSLKHLVDRKLALAFFSKDEPDQWVCWDFGELVIRPTHYAVEAWFLRSWVLEGSWDGGSWTEIDREIEDQNFKGPWAMASFSVSKPAEFRFVRLRQRGRNHHGYYDLRLGTFEFFGTLYE
jgi:hypothetical protein